MVSLKPLLSVVIFNNSAIVVSVYSEHEEVKVSVSVR